MAWTAQSRQPSSDDGWAALGWSVTTLLSAGLLGALALPGTTPSAYVDFDRGDFIRPEWLVLATLLAYPVFLAARASWIVAVPVVCLLVGESWYVVDSALASLQQVGLSAPISDSLLYSLLIAHVAVFTTAGAAGVRRCLERRRWMRQMRRLVPELAAADLSERDAWPAWREGFFSTG